MITEVCCVHLEKVFVDSGRACGGICFFPLKLMCAKNAGNTIVEESL